MYWDEHVGIAFTDHFASGEKWWIQEVQISLKFYSKICCLIVLFVKNPCPLEVFPPSLCWQDTSLYTKRACILQIKDSKRYIAHTHWSHCRWQHLQSTWVRNDRLLTQLPLFLVPGLTTIQVQLVLLPNKCQ